MSMQHHVARQFRDNYADSGLVDEAKAHLSGQISALRLGSYDV
jgi:hypothetical protein